MLFQVLANGLALGGLYACIAAGFSLVWGVLNIINVTHGSLIVLGAYAAFFAYQQLGVSPYLFAPVAGLALFCLAYPMQRFVIERVMGRPVLITLALTFGLNLLLDNAMLLAFSADYRQVTLHHSLGTLAFGGALVPLDRILATSIGLFFVAILYFVLRLTPLGRSIIAIRMDREAARLMGIDIPNVNSIAFALGAFMAGAAGALLAPIFPISPLASSLYLGKAFVVCVLGGLGSIPGAVIGGIALGLIESGVAYTLGPEQTLPISFAFLILMLMARPTGLLGRRAFI